MDRLERIGEQDLQRNLIQLRKLAAEISPEHDVASFLQETKKNHPAASMLTAETRGTLEDIRQFVAEKDSRLDPFQRSMHRQGNTRVHAMGLRGDGPARSVRDHR